METKFFGETNNNKFIKELKKVFNLIFIDKNKIKQNIIPGNIIKASKNGELVDVGISIVKCTKHEYDSIIDKDTNTLYIVDCNVPTFGGLQLASGPLFYDGNGFAIKSNWRYDSYDNIKGLDAGSIYFSHVELGKLFDNPNYTKDSGKIINNLNPLNGWRLIENQEEASKIISFQRSERTGSTVNGVNNAHRAIIKLSGKNVSICNNETPMGIILFPDGKIINGRQLNGYDNSSVTEGVLLEELNTYINQGCCFIPAYGIYYYGWSNGGKVHTTWLADVNETKGAAMTIGSSYMQFGSYDAETVYISPILVKPAETGIKIYFGSTLVADSNTFD